MQRFHRWFYRYWKFWWYKKTTSYFFDSYSIIGFVDNSQYRQNFSIRRQNILLVFFNFLQVLEIMTAKPISLARSCNDMPILDHQFLNKYQKHNIAITITSKNILQTKRGNALTIMSYIVLLLTVYYELITTVSFSSSNIFNYTIACIVCGFFFFFSLWSLLFAYSLELKVSIRFSNLIRGRFNEMNFKFVA